VGRRTGRAELDEHAEGVHVSELDVGIKPAAELTRPLDDIKADIRGRLINLPAAIDGEAARFAVAQLAARSFERAARGESEPVATTVTLAHLNAPPPHAAVAGREAPRELDVPLHDPAWSSEFGHKLLWLAGNDRQVAQLSLHPPQLGSIDIILNVNKESADAHFVSPSADVRGTIEAAVPRLREMFALAGIDLGQVSVGSESFQRQTGDQPGQPRQPRVAADNAILAGDSASALPGKTFVTRCGHGLIDIFA